MKTTAAKKSTDADTLAELVCGIVIWGLTGQAAALLLFKRPGIVYVSVCWWLGVAVAVIWAVHIRAGLVRALSLGMGDAQGLLRFHAIVRYLVAAAVMLVIYLIITNFADDSARIYATAYVPGIMTLKAGAYSQPFLHKAFLRSKG